jgi:hypothetical protein
VSYSNCWSLREVGNLLAKTFLPNATTAYLLNYGHSLPKITPVSGRHDNHVLLVENSDEIPFQQTAISLGS